MPFQRYLLVFASGCALLMAETPTPSKGTEIGQTINDAITAALPGAELVFNLVRKFLPGKDNDKVTKPQVDEAVRKAVAEVKEQAKKDSALQLARLSGVVAEIELTTKLGQSAGLATENLVVIRARLGARLTAEGWKEIHDEWEGQAKKSLEAVVAFDESKISDPTVKSEMAALKASSTRDLSDLEKQIKAQNAPQATAFLLHISGRLENLRGAPAIQLQSFGKQLASLSAPPQKTTDAPPPGPPPLNPLADYLASTNKQFP